MLLKGVAVAHTVYRSPRHRPSGDVDIIVPIEARHSAAQVLNEAGFIDQPSSGGQFASYQSAWRYHDANHPTPAVDLHWRMSNVQLIAHALPFDRVHASARQLVEVGPHAMVPSFATLLHHACLHRIAHRHGAYYVDDDAVDPDRLLWLEDVRLLCTAMNNTHWEAFIDDVRVSGTAALCLNSLTCAASLLAFTIPPDIERRLAQMPTSSASKLLLKQGAANQFASDPLCLPSLSDKFQLVREHCFPSRNYMRNVYAPGDNSPLAVSYVRRLALRVARRMGSSGMKRQ